MTVHLFHKHADLDFIYIILQVIYMYIPQTGEDDKFKLTQLRSRCQKTSCNMRTMAFI